MEFTVPQFIEYESKVIGPFSFKQFIIVAVAGIICAVVALKTPLFISIPVIICVGGGTMGLIFFKIGGIHPLVVFKNLFSFSLAPKVYVWQRKISVPKVVIKKDAPKEEEEPLRGVTRKGRLENLSMEIETKN